MKSKAMYYINSAITVVLMFGANFLPTPDFISQQGFATLGIFFACIWGWSTVGIVWPSLLALIALGFLGDNTVAGVFQSGWGSSTFILVLMITLFAGVVTQSGLGKHVANFILARKAVRKTPWFLSLAILFVAYATAFTVSIIPGIIITWGILDSICKQCGFTKKDSWPKWMTVGVVLACCMGHSAWPIEALAFTFFGIFTREVGASINYLSFTALNVSIGILCILLFAFVSRLFMKTDMKRLKGIDLQFAKNPTLTRYQKQVLILILVFFCFLFIPGALPDAGGLIGLLNTIGTGGCAALVVCLATFIRRKNGEPFYDILKAFKESVPWESMFLIATVMPLTEALTNPTAGLNNLFNQGFSMLFGGIENGIWFIILFILIMVILTNVMSNMTVGIIMIPLACLFAPSIGVNPALLTVVSCIACNAALVLPSGGPTAAVLHGNMQWFENRGQISGRALVAAGVFTVAAWVMSLTLGQILFP